MTGPAAEIERELAEYLDAVPYEVRFRHACGYSWFYAYVFCDGTRIAEKSCCRSYPRAARWAKRKVREHRQAISILGSLHRPAEPAREQVPA